MFNFSLPNEYNLVCPNENCFNIPEIIYSDDILNPNVNYNCNFCKEKGKIEISKFLKKSFLIKCPICNKQIINDSNFYYCKTCKNICHKNCDNHIKIYKSKDYLFNNCLIHDSTFLFRCKNCKKSFCQKCKPKFHSSSHNKYLLQNIMKNQHEKEKKEADFKKQKDYLEQILEMNEELIIFLKNEICLKEKIIKNYNTYHNNYESIINFNNLKIENEPKYEKILKNILEEYKENHKKGSSKWDSKSFCNRILSIIYFILMINQNKGLNKSLFNELENIVENNCEYQKIFDKNQLYNILNNNDNFWNNNKENTKNINNMNENINEMNIKNNWKNNPTKNKDKLKNNYQKYWSKSNNEIKEIANPFIEINNIECLKGINHMIILNSGNIAVSSYKIIYIYSKAQILSKNNDNKTIINIELNKKKPITYLHQLPDDTLIFGTYSKIYRIKLNEKEKNYDFLEFIKLEKSELIKKIISLGKFFLLTLSEKKNTNYLRLGIKFNFDFSFSGKYNDNANNNDKMIDLKNNNITKYIFNDIDNKKNIKITEFNLESNNSYYISKNEHDKSHFLNYKGKEELDREFKISNNIN